MFNIRIYTIDFTAETILPTDGSILGYQGENNATTLSIIPPEEMTACEDIVAYKVAFELNNCRHTRSETIAKNSPVEVLLSSLITSSKEISVQLEGYGADGNLVVKSPKVTKLTFDDSVGGVSVDNESENAAAAEIAANTVARHTHENADILNELAENEEGNLTYKGSKIGGGERATETAEFDANGGTISITEGANNSLIFKVSESAGISAGDIVTDVEFLYDGNYISIKELYLVDGQNYFYNIGRTFADAEGVFVANIGFGGTMFNTVIQSFYNYESSIIRVTYYKN